ncbi:hypothetical protein ACFY5D_17895 [Paeniglutamicibacter sp. NPDC012692]|uniref:hypothetical protein n=1 Tax=Paeniglutamicibacter sp. NPDC012692 TaxID=3364388 RepID=UPI003697433E
MARSTRKANSAFFLFPNSCDDCANFGGGPVLAEFRGRLVFDDQLVAQDVLRPAGDEAFAPALACSDPDSFRLPGDQTCLPAATGETVEPADFSVGSTVLFIYALIVRQDRVEPPEWSLVAGAKGCTRESCEFRDLSADYADIGFRVNGHSSQNTECR